MAVDPRPALRRHDSSPLIAAGSPGSSVNVVTTLGPFDPSGDAGREPPQSAEEVKAHLGPDGPVAPAYDFLAAIYRGKFRAVWRLMDENLRRACLQDVLWANRAAPHTLPRYAWRHRDELVDMLAVDEPPRNDFWVAFQARQLEALAEAVTDDPRGLSAASRPRPMGDDLELVLLIDSQGQTYGVDRPTAVKVTFAMLMRRTDTGWRVAAMQTDTPPVQGYPPTWGSWPQLDGSLPDHN